MTLLTIVLPLVCYAFAFLCNDTTGCPAPAVLHPSTLTWAKLGRETGWPGVLGLTTPSVFLWVLSYYLLSLTLFAFLPGEVVEGTTLRSGARLKYKFNGFASSLVTLGAAGLGTLLYGADFVLWTYIWDHYVSILTANMLIAFALSCYVYHRSFSVHAGYRHHRELALGGHTGHLVYDWFIGRELNPRVTLPVIGEIDIKTFGEMRPGLLGYMLLNFAFVAAQYRLHGFVTDGMVLLVGAQVFYVLDALYMEPAMLTTIDITTDGFGFMLAFGDLVWLPFTYSIQARYLAVFPHSLGAKGLLGLFAVLGTGYYIFRGANNEKNRFRTNPEDPKVKHLEYIKTANGSKLLCSGWWGRARHINYLGDWIMGWAYVLPTGVAGYMIRPHITFPLGGRLTAREEAFPIGRPAAMEVYQGDARGWAMIITYFYMLYFAILLVHRERRDEAKCAKKYGKDWEEYKKRVPWRIIPYVY